MTYRTALAGATGAQLPRRPAPGRAAAEEPEVVQVHIGRVDVRAVLPPPEPARARPPAARREAPLSLDRYLAGEKRA